MAKKYKLHVGMGQQQVFRSGKTFLRPEKSIAIGPFAIRPAVREISATLSLC
jgi:hypothetical protein